MTERGGRKPTGSHNGTSLSEEDVERRLGGGAGLRVMHVRPRRVDARARVARDTMTLLGGALAALLAWQLVGGGTPGPGDGSIPLPDDTGIVVGSFEAPPTLGPLDTLGPIANASIGLGASPTPVPFETLGPGTLTVVVQVTNDNGGNDVASSWTITVKGGSSSPSTFTGSASGTTIPIDPGATFTISTAAKTPSGYVESRSGNCSGPIPKGVSATCTIAENDKPVSLTVKVVIKGGTATAGQVTVSVVGTGVDKPSFKGSASGTLVHLNANSRWTVKTTPSSLANYVRTSTSGCASTTGAAEGAAVACTFTFTYSPPPTPAPSPTPAPTASPAPSILPSPVPT